MQPTYDICVAGNLIVDMIKMIPRFPSEQALVPILSMSRAIGGAVCNVLIDLARLDDALRLHAVGFVGEDELGDWMLSEMANYPSISLDGIAQKGKTSFSDVMTVKDSGKRTFFSYKGADNLLGAEDALRALPDCKLLHIGYILLLDGMDAPDDEYGTVMARVLCKAKERGIQTSIDVVSEDSDRFLSTIQPSLRYTDYCCINEFEAERLSGVLLRDKASGVLLRENCKEACQIIRAMGVSQWITIHAPEGAFGLDSDDQYHEVDSLRLPDRFIQGSVGAGDAFAAGMLYEAVQGATQETAMKTACAVAACSLSEPDATSGVRSYEKTQALRAALALASE